MGTDGDQRSRIVSIIDAPLITTDANHSLNCISFFGVMRKLTHTEIASSFLELSTSNVLFTEK